MESCTLPTPDPVRALSEVETFRGSGLHSLYCLRLTLEDILAKCQQDQDNCILEEFPFSASEIILSTDPPLSPTKPQTHLDLTKFSGNWELQLATLTELYRGRIQWLSSGSRLTFGHVRGSKVALLLDTSNEHCQGDEPRIGGCTCAVKELMLEQLSKKEVVYLMEFGSKVTPIDPPALPFEASTESCCKVTSEWLLSLEGSGSCNLMEALETALNLNEVDTILVVIASKPDQQLELVLDYVVDMLAGGSGAQRLHLVAFETSDETAVYLERLANGTAGGHYHRFTSTKETDGQSSGALVEDSEISRLGEEIATAQTLLHNLTSLRSGTVTGCLVKAFRELSLSYKWTPQPERSTEVDWLSSPVEEHAIVCSAEQWLDEFGVTARGLNLYHFLAPNAYPQLDGFISSVDRKAVSQVYDVMPLFLWYDGSRKYLHVDVPRLEGYQRKVEDHIEGRLRERVGWILSGSRVPFGVITEKRVLMVLDCSLVLLPHILTLQHHLRMVLRDQLANSTAFNLVRFGKECSTWADRLVEPHEEGLQDALEWVMGMSPSGSCNLLAALKEVFESDAYLHNGEIEGLGIYFVVSALPDQDTDVLLSYVEQQLSGLRGLVTIHVTFYNTEPCTEGACLVVSGQHGGRYGSEEEIEFCLRQLANAGGGNFHHFRATSSSVEGDDITAMLEELVESNFYLQSARDIVSNYRVFCKRNIPPPTPEGGRANIPVRRSPPPLYPRQTAASLARLNTIMQKIQDRTSPKLPWTPKYSRKRHATIKMQMFYLDQGLRKGLVSDVLEKAPLSARAKNKPLIPSREEYLTSTEWLARYGLETLRLCFTGLKPTTPSTGTRHKTLYKHVNNRGQMVELSVSHQGLKSYVKKLQFALQRYQGRLDWLLSDDYKFFGTIVEKAVVFVVDVSSSMSAHFHELYSAMAHLLQNKPPTLKSFTIVAYGSSVTKWRDTLTPATDTNCRDALRWLDSLRPGGCSCLLKALRESLQIGLEAACVCLVTDGAADHTHEFLLNQLPLLRRAYGKSWHINTVAFHCSNEKSHNSLKTLASKTNGRYHCYPIDFTDRGGTRLCDHQMSEGRTVLSAAHQNCGTDIVQLTNELLLAQSYMKEVRRLL